MDTDVAGGWLVPVASGEVLRLLATVRAGRVAYVDQALPGIQVATHVVDGGEVIIRSQGRSPVISPVSAGEVVLAYEAGAVDPRTLRGWSVTVTGSAALVGDVEEMARYDRVLPRWPGSGGGGQLIRVCPGRVSGYRVVEPGAGWPGGRDGA